MVWAAMTTLTSVSKVPLTLRVHKVTSTLRTLQPAAQDLFLAATAHLQPASTAGAAEAAPDAKVELLQATYGEMLTVTGGV